jgi:hypothetical protein
VTLEECERGNKMNAVGRRNLKKKKKSTLQIPSAREKLSRVSFTWAKLPASFVPVC